MYKESGRFLESLQLGFFFWKGFWSAVFILRLSEWLERSENAFFFVKDQKINGILHREPSDPNHSSTASKNKNIYEIRLSTWVCWQDIRAACHGLPPFSRDQHQRKWNTNQNKWNIKGNLVKLETGLTFTRQVRICLMKGPDRLTFDGLSHQKLAHLVLFLKTLCQTRQITKLICQK